MSEDIKIAKDSIDEETVEGVRSLEADKYKYGFDSDIEQEFERRAAMAAGLALGSLSPLAHPRRA